MYSIIPWKHMITPILRRNTLRLIALMDFSDKLCVLSPSPRRLLIMHKCLNSLPSLPAEDIMHVEGENKSYSVFRSKSVLSFTIQVL